MKLQNCHTLSESAPARRAIHSQSLSGPSCSNLEKKRVFDGILSIFINLSKSTFHTKQKKNEDHHGKIALKVSKKLDIFQKIGGLVLRPILLRPYVQVIMGDY